MSFQDKLRSYAVLVAVNAVAVAAFVVLGVTTQRPLGYALAAAAVAALYGRSRRGGFGDTVSAQALVAAGIFADAFRHDTAGPAAARLAAAAETALLLVNQPVLEFLVTRPGVKVANLPGYAPPRATLVKPKTVYTSFLGLLVVAGVIAAAGWSGWLLLAAALAVGLVAGLVGLQAIRQRLNPSLAEKPLRAALAAYDAKFALYFSAPDNTEYQVKMWLPYLERIGEPFIVIHREPKAFGPLTRLAEAGGVPVVYCPGVAQIDLVVSESMRACFYVNNAALNSHMVRFGHMTHIQLLHGDSDKAASANQVTAMFNKVFVAGQAAIDRYAANGVHIPERNFQIVGRPQVEAIDVATAPIASVPAKTVLYATTWVGLYTDSRYCSLPIGEEIVRGLIARGCRVVMRPHPYSGRHPESALQVSRISALLAEDRAASGREHVFGAEASRQMTLIECINASDALVGDVGSVVSDWLYSEKPFALTNMVDKAPADFEAAFPQARVAYVLDDKAANLDSVLDELLDADPAAAARREMKTFYLGDFPAGSYADGFVDAARSYVV
jgi:hypothetical protein